MSVSLKAQDPVRVRSAHPVWVSLRAPVPVFQFIASSVSQREIKNIASPPEKKEVAQQRIFYQPSLGYVCMAPTVLL